MTWRLSDVGRVVGRLPSITLPPLTIHIPSPSYCGSTLQQHSSGHLTSPPPPQSPALRPVKCAHRTNRACIRRTASLLHRYPTLHPLSHPLLHLLIIHTYCPSPFYPICAPWIRFSCQPRTPAVASHPTTQLVDAPIHLGLSRASSTDASVPTSSFPNLLYL